LNQVVAMSERDQPQTPSKNKPDEVSRFSTDFRFIVALVRTALSSEQSLMAWIRTSLSLFTFGFSITQFFYYLERRQGSTEFSSGPRRLGISLVCLGILVLVLAMIEHAQTLRRMKEQGMPPDAKSFLPIASAAGLLAIGIAGLTGILFNWHL